MNPAHPNKQALNNLRKGGVKVVNVSKGTLLADKAEIANTFLGRLIGLLNRHSLKKGEALILTPSNCIHSLFMRLTIDAIFLDKTGKVIGALHSFKPFRFSPIYFNSTLTIELPEHTLQITQTGLGDIIKIL
jgi:uncharacterized membrane protein (UPF0127 family)